MSSDEEMAVIGKLVVEKKDLARRNAALHSEIYKIGERIQKLGAALSGGGTGASMWWGHELTVDEKDSLDVEKLDELLEEKAEVVKRLTEVQRLLREAGIE